MRSLALAEAAQSRGMPVHFICNAKPAELLEPIQSKGFPVFTIPRSYPDPTDSMHVRGIVSEPNSIVVLDGYHFDKDYHLAIKSTGAKLLVIDDYAHLPGYDCDVILNQNLDADSLAYSISSDAVFLLGNRYVLLRSEFLKKKTQPKEVPSRASHLLVTFGGADPAGAAVTAAQALAILPEPYPEVKIVAGGANPRFQELSNLVKNLSFPVEVLGSVSEMSGLMQWADSALAAASSTAYELALMQVPGMLIVTATNQEALAAGFVRRHCAEVLGMLRDLSPRIIADHLRVFLNDSDNRKALAERAGALVDGLGGARVMETLDPTRINLRITRPEDSSLVWLWANDPEARRVSFQTAPIPWQDHLQWFSRKLADPDCVYFIVENQYRHPLGQIRFDLTGQEATVSVSLDPAFRGIGLGARLIVLGCQKFSEIMGGLGFRAMIKKCNAVSIRAFQKAGFQIVEDILYHETPTVILRRQGQAT